MEHRERYLAGRRNIMVALSVNGALFLLKLLSGLFGRSQAMLTDAAHTLSDILTSVVVLVGLRIACHPEDSGHPYGHGKFETMSTAILALLLCATGWGFFYRGAVAVIAPRQVVPGLFPLAAAAISVAVKEWLYRLTIRTGREIDSRALEADAWHHRSDAFSSLPAFFGILAARLGLPVMDPLAAVFIAVFVMRTGLQLGLDAFQELVESALDRPTIDLVRAEALAVAGVLRLHDLKGRRLGSEIIVELHVLVAGSLSVQEGHRIADQVEHRLKNRVPGLIRATVHIDPEGRET